MNLSEYSRRPSGEVRIGRVVIGGGHPVAVQSMTNTDTNDTEACAAQIDLGRAGFGIVGVGIGHRLYGDRMPAADHDPPDAHFAARTAAVFRKIHNRSRLQRS